MTRKRLTWSLGLGVLVVLAGCSGLAAEEQSRTETVTPAPVPAGDESLPPGISETGVTTSLLTNAHERQLRKTNYTLVSRQWIVGPNGTMRRTNWTRRVAVRGERYVGHFDRTVHEFPVEMVSTNVDVWTNGTVSAYRRSTAGESAFYGWAENGQPPGDVDGSQLFGRILETVAPPTVTRKGGGVVLISNAIRQPERFPTPPSLSDPRNVSLEARVGPGGVVSYWRLAYDATVDGRTVRVIRETHLASVGTTTVDRPGWIDDAREWAETHRYH